MSEGRGGGDETFFARVYALVRRVPRGRVVTYGQVAAMLGVPRGARAVGWALRALPEDEAARVPWHRVVGAGGRISPRRGPGPEIQRRRLRGERVAFRGANVDMTRHGLGSFKRPRRASEWTPSVSEVKRGGFGSPEGASERPDVDCAKGHSTRGAERARYSQRRPKAALKKNRPRSRRAQARSGLFMRTTRTTS